jgi:hypothetical protein
VTVAVACTFRKQEKIEGKKGKGEGKKEKRRR